MISEEIRLKLSKVYELVNNGATEGEKSAAKKALERILQKYNITEEQLADVSLKQCAFKYSSMLELYLVSRLIAFFFPELYKQAARKTFGTRAVVLNMNHMDWVTLESAYEYFRRHMKKEWQRLCVPELNRCRKQNTRIKRKKELENLFFGQYIIASKLHKPEEVKKINSEELTEKEIRDRMKLNDLEGGSFNRQIHSNLLLN
jgi:hypothetical protein